MVGKRRFVRAYSLSFASPKGALGHRLNSLLGWRDSFHFYGALAMVHFMHWPPLERSHS